MFVRKAGSASADVEQGVTHGQFEEVVSLAARRPSWVVLVLVPRAKREQNQLAVVCGMFAPVVALLGWLLLGSGVRSR
jgi:hypothetical protein